MRVRYTADGGHYRVGGHGFDPGDVRDVDEDLGEYLEDHDDFEVVEETATCEIVKDDGEVCGRELPCPYHSDDEEA